MRTTFSTAGHDGPDRVALWHDVVCRTFVPLDVAPGLPEDFTGRVASDAVGELQLTRVAAQPQVVRRTRTLIDRDDAAYATVGLQLAGRSVVVQDDRQAALRPGQLVLYDTRRPYTLVFDQAFDWLVLQVPEPVARRHAVDLSRRTAVPLSPADGTCGVLVATLRALHSAGGGASPTATDRVQSAVLDLLGSVVGDPRDGDPRPGRSLYVQALAHVERHLAEPELGPTTVAAALHVSVRYLHRAFEREGQTVAGLVRRRRLQACRRDLLQTGPHGRSAAAVGHRWGFADPAHFSRAFKAAYGVPPAQYRDRVAGEAVGGGDGPV